MDEDYLQDMGDFSMEKVITIGREFGSGGREIGLKVAETLQIPFYDKELISMAAEQGELAPTVVEHYEETVMHTGFYLARPALFNIYSQPITDKIFIDQYHAIQKLAKQGVCVIVGRCSDYVLKDAAINVFVYAEMGTRIRRKLALDIGIAERDMEKHIRTVDKKRSEYYRCYTEQLWGKAQNYHLCVDTSAIGVAGAVEMILQYCKCCGEAL